MKNTSTFFTDVRYYGPLDPYFYSVDNRPLGDLANNITQTAVGVDSVRNLHETLAYSVGAFLGASAGTYGTFLSPRPTLSNLSLTVPEGIVIKELAASQLDTTVVSKLAPTAAFNYTFTAPANSGESQVFVLEAAFVNIVGGEVVPILDTSNPQTLDNNLTGVGTLQVIAGTSATTGTETAPAVTSGFFPLMKVTIANGQSSISEADVEYSNLFWMFSDSLRVLNGGGMVTSRQTVLRGPVDGSGNPSLISAGSGLAVNFSASSQVDICFARGYSQARAFNILCSLTRSITGAWSGLAASSTAYLYIELDPTTGWSSYGISYTAPTYAAVAPATPANNDSWYDTVNEVMYSWDSTSSNWDVVNRVFVGEAVTGTSSVTSVTTYAYRVSH